MATSDPRIDAYVANAPEPARSLLVELRRRVHEACPDVIETIKWRRPAFEHHGLLGGMAAFRHYTAFGFWKEKLLAAERPQFAAAIERCGRLTDGAGLPGAAVFRQLLRRAMRLNEQGITTPPATPRRAGAGPRTAPAMHPEFAAALARDAAASAHLAKFAPSRRREYLEWIAEAKQETTRQRRIAQAIAWLAAGKHRNWKYERR